jgi:hypothetical protein
MRFKAALAKILAPAYPEEMGIARSVPSGHIPPVPRPIGIEQYAGRWVAVANGVVVAAADTSRGLARELIELGPAAEDAVMQFVRPPVAGYVIGVG